MNNNHDDVLKEIAKTIDDIIAINYESMSSKLGKDFLPNAKHILLKTKKTSTEIIENNYTKEEDLNPNQRAPELLTKAAFSLAQAKIDRDSEEFSKCIQSLTTTYYYLGQMEKTDAEIRREREKRKKSGSNAATARHEINQELKDKVASLLQQRKPKGGWQSINNAARTILEEIEDFMKEKKFSIKIDNIHQQMVKWMRQKNNFLRRIYIENASEKSRKSLKPDS